jgi:hypothetical protein
MSYKIDKQSLIYKTLELNERFLVGGDNEPNPPVPNAQPNAQPNAHPNAHPNAEPTNASEAQKSSAAGNGTNKIKNNSNINLEKRKGNRENFFKGLTMLLGGIIYVLYLPLLPWIKLTQAIWSRLLELWDALLKPL